MSLPNGAGLSLKAEHFDSILNLIQSTPESSPDSSTVSWFECHPENYFGAGGEPHFYLETVTQHFPLSMHGVSLSLGSSDGLCKKHLQKLKNLFDRYRPAQISEHLAWSNLDGHYLNDLLPIPYTEETFEIVRDNILHTQDTIGRKILIENPSLYLQFNQNTLTEPDFLNRLCKETQCGILLDINNVSVSSFNSKHHAHTKSHIQLAKNYLNSIEFDYVGEIHLAGHTLMPLVETEEPEQNNLQKPQQLKKTIRIDDHGSKVSTEVWSLFDYALEKANKLIPTMVEWDSNIPDFSVFIEEAKQTQEHLNQVPLAR